MGENDLIRQFIIDCLDKYFAAFPTVTTDMFPDDEFSCEEAMQLKRLCMDIHKRGYGFICDDIVNDDLKILLVTATEYGVFVDEKIGYQYLGLYIITHLLMTPFSVESYCSEILRSGIYKNSSSFVKDLSRFLMLLATFDSNKYISSSRGEAFNDLIVDEFRGILCMMTEDIKLEPVMKTLAGPCSVKDHQNCLKSFSSENNV